MAIISKRYSVQGMQCLGCEDIISELLNEMPGIQTNTANFAGAWLDVTYDDSLINEELIGQQLQSKGYSLQRVITQKTYRLKAVVLFVGLLLTVGGVTFWGKSLMPNIMQQIKPDMGYPLLLGLGFLTGFHCIGMCGGFVVAYTDSSQSKARQLWAHGIYGIAKTLSYGLLGGAFGLVGASVAITPTLRGILALLASVFLVVYGLKMLNVFTWIRRFTLRLPVTVNQQLAGQLRQRYQPLRTGLLSGLLLGCGPLQAMYVLAAGMGDPMRGGIMLSLFGIGTLLPLLSFGVFASLVSGKAMSQMRRVSAIMVMVMGLMMAQRGVMLLKSNPSHTPAPQLLQVH